MKIVAIIPAHMSSVRFPGKILFPIHGLPMIEHVRRRALMSKLLSDVIVATCDESIATVIRNYGGKVIMTANTHENGTARIAEAIKFIDCSHAMLIQGDEPLILPNHIDTLVNEINKNIKNNAWNITGPIEKFEEMDRHSFVKCVINKNDEIIYCFRKSPFYSNFEKNKYFVRKILGLIAYEKNFLLELVNFLPGNIENTEFIEQMRIVENRYSLKSVPIKISLPSVNEPHEIDTVLKYIENDIEQKIILNQILN